MLTTEKCILAIEEAIRKFGEYNYYDKGPAEVMDIKALCDMAKDMQALELLDIFLTVKTHEHGEQFVSTMLSALDYREDLDDLYRDKRLWVLY